MGLPIYMELQHAKAGNQPETRNLEILEYFAEVGQQYCDTTGELTVNLAEIEAWQLLGRPENPAGHVWDDSGVCQFCDEVEVGSNIKWCPWNRPI